MRQIKFRAWDGKQMTMDFFITSEGIIFQAHYNNTPTIKPDYNLMQYTGLKDTKGKEIYEGDILTSINSSNIVVCWDEIPGRWVGHDKKHFNEDLYYYNCGEIIGNIHENPELLK
jgi:uncharacterized phage protein (TIGR01671 family)